jgi:lipopolysaccharide export system protein LptA
MMTSRRHLGVAAAFAAAMAFASAGAHAQPGGGPPNALQGFSRNRSEPVKIEAASLEVRDKEKKATFSGDVHLVQGDTDMRCKVLVVYYEGDIGKAGPQGKKGSGSGNQQIRRMEARGGVTVVQKEQTATGERGDFDMRSNTVTLTGNVVVAKGENVLRGQKLVVNLTSGVSRMESGGGRVEGLFKSSPSQKPGAAPNQSNRN